MTPSQRREVVDKFIAGETLWGISVLLWDLTREPTLGDAVKRVEDAIRRELKRLIKKEGKR